MQCGIVGVLNFSTIDSTKFSTVVNLTVVEYTYTHYLWTRINVATAAVSPPCCAAIYSRSGNAIPTTLNAKCAGVLYHAAARRRWYLFGVSPQRKTL